MLDGPPAGLTPRNGVFSRVAVAEVPSGQDTSADTAAKQPPPLRISNFKSAHARYRVSGGINPIPSNTRRCKAVLYPQGACRLEVAYSPFNGGKQMLRGTAKDRFLGPESRPADAASTPPP